ncbi:MAG: hypothetical protein JRJ12_03525 [Deltaproteobacteria bacterium]|nr:hypothetical protein [Deltaproteobacteria bacterium]MBW2070300.1 hypothetical protein [Deltaproteobacteria bacterium]
MAAFALPEDFFAEEFLQELLELLLRKATALDQLTARDFGPRILRQQEAEALLAEAMEICHELLHWQPAQTVKPRLVLTRRLSRLWGRTMILFLLFVPLSMLLFFLTARVADSSSAYWLVRGAIFFLLAVPLLIHKRTRINIEHQCGYVRDARGRSAIVIDQLPRVQLQSYLAHEYAHHLYADRQASESLVWRRHGWARLLQWQAVKQLAARYQNPAFHYHALEQVVAELKFACELILRSRQRKMPRPLQRVPTLYQANPLRRLLTGVPGYNTSRLIEHAVGTANVFVRAKQSGFASVLNEELLQSTSSAVH